MLLRAFLSSHKARTVGLACLSLGIAACEGAFVLLGKVALLGSMHVTLAALAASLCALVSARSLLQMAAAKLEAKTVFAWVAGLRTGLLALAGRREFPAYRPPFRAALAGVLGPGLERLGDGLLGGLRCQAALAQAVVLLPLLLVFSWKPALAAVALAGPALWASRLRVRALEAASLGWRVSRAAAAADLEAFADGWESHAGNGALQESIDGLSKAQGSHEAQSRRWEFAKSLFPPAMEWFFFMALAALFGLATGLGAGPESLAPFAALLLLLYRPIREWARNFPVYLSGDGAWREFRALEASLSALAPSRAPALSHGGTIRAQGLRFGYAPGFGTGPAGLAAPPRMILEDLDLDLSASELIMVSGQNGAGKSTLLKLLAGIESPQAGTLLMPARAHPCAYLPQKVFVAADYREWAQAMRRDRGGDWSRLEACLGLGAILSKAGTQPGWASGLSGGERQRLALGRVFASRSGYLLLDEPTTFLAAGDRERIMEELLAFWRGNGTRGGLIVSHEPFLAEFCSRTLHIEKLGHPVESRPA